MNALSPSPSDRPSYGLWSLWDMLQSFYPFYKIALELQRLRDEAARLKDLFSTNKVLPFGDVRFREFLQTVEQECLDHDFIHTSDLAKRQLSRPSPDLYTEMHSMLTYLNDSLSGELERESVFRIHPDRKKYFESTDLFGAQVALAFPSCERDIQRAGSCYALEQEDACVHHLMLVLERGLNALAAKFGVPFHRTNWQNIIEQIASKLKSEPRGLDRDFYVEANAQFGFLKDAYRNHAEHARDDPYDMEKALSILNHVRAFMNVLASRCDENGPKA